MRQLKNGWMTQFTHNSIRLLIS